jgi:predicted ATP-grasp superfamily ATP-dependent carboligase
MTTAKRVLVLDGHTNQALASVRTLGSAGSHVLVASHRRYPLAAWSRFCQGRFRLPGQTVEAFAELRRWARQQGIEVVLPLTERACLLCNAERQEWEALGVVVGCASNEVLLRAFDKAETIRYAEKCGVRIPPTRTPGSLDECRAAGEALGYPCVIKPRFSHAWDGKTFLPNRGPSYVHSGQDIRQMMATNRQGDHWPLIQGFVPGQGRGVFALCDRGRPVAWFAHERLREVRPTGSASSLRRSIPLEPRLREPAERLLAEMQWHGPAMVEFKDDGVHPPCLMEVNGRFWGSLQLAIDAGIDFPSLWLAIVHGNAVECAPEYAEEVTLRWLWGDFKRLLYIMAGRPMGYPDRYPTVWQGLAELFGAQPTGTRLEIWNPHDPWPAAGEWVEGIRQLLVRQ